MLCVNLYESIDEVYSLSFLQDQSRENVVICPNPSEADIFRSNLDQNSNISVITISKFMSESIERCLGDLVIMRKSELMLHLATIWKKKGLELSNDAFFQAFTLFTELRSYTLNLELVNEALDSLDKEIAEIIKIFWIYTDSLEKVDEQKSYSLLSEGFEAEDKNYIFWAFPHMNAHQIDLLNSISKSGDVYVPFSKEAFTHSTRQDWVRWLKAEKLEKTALEKNKKIKAISFPKGRISQYLKEYLNNNESPAKIILAEKTPPLENLLEIPIKDINFRTSNDIFISELEKSFVKVEEILSSGVSQSDELKNKLLESIKDEISNESPNFRKVTTLKILFEKILMMQRLSDENENFSMFDLQLLKEVAPLDLPRTYFVPLTEQSELVQLAGLEELNEKDDSGVLLCVASKYQSLKGGTSKFNEEITTFLSTIGPVQRKELEFQVIKSKLNSLFEKEAVTLFIEDGLLEHDLGWSEIIGDEERLDLVGVSPKKKERKEFFSYQSIDANKGMLSASKLQSYRDCPRKYYYNYLERLELNLEITQDIQAKDLGILEHDIIGKYYEEFDKLDDKDLYDFSKKSVDEFLAVNKIVLNSSKYEKYLREIYLYSRNGLLEVYKLKTAFPELVCHFEYDLKNIGPFSGSIDLYGETDEGFFIIDFKRSSGSVPEAKELNDFLKIQLWFYLDQIEQTYKGSCLFGGYLNLSEVDKSRFLINENTDTSGLKEVTFGNGSFKSARGFNFEDKLSEYKEFISEFIEGFRNDTVFVPKPSTSKVCTFCKVKNICTRGERYE